MARTITFVISCFLDGAIAPNAPNIIPMEPTFENPHRAYVAITNDLGLCKDTYNNFLHKKVPVKVDIHAVLMYYLFHRNRPFHAKCVIVDECTWKNMVNVYFRRRKILFVLPKPYVAEVYIKHAY